VKIIFATLISGFSAGFRRARTSRRGTFRREAGRPDIARVAQLFFQRPRSVPFQLWSQQQFAQLAAALAI